MSVGIQVATLAGECTAIGRKQVTIIGAKYMSL